MEEKSVEKKVGQGDTGGQTKAPSREAGQQDEPQEQCAGVFQGYQLPDPGPGKGIKEQVPR